jgi:PiT family inorganic phosphate transporter
VGEVAEGKTPDTETLQDKPAVPPIGEEDIEELTAESLFDPTATTQVVVLWILTPTLSVVGSSLLFALIL